MRISFFSEAFCDRWTNLKETKVFQNRNLNPSTYFSIIPGKCSFSDQMVVTEKIPSWKLEMYASSCFVYSTNMSAITITICAPYCLQRPYSREICEEKQTGFAYSKLGVGFSVACFGQWLNDWITGAQLRAPERLGLITSGVLYSIPDARV